MIGSRAANQGYFLAGCDNDFFPASTSGEIRILIVQLTGSRGAIGGDFRAVGETKLHRREISCAGGKDHVLRDNAKRQRASVECYVQTFGKFGRLRGEIRRQAGIPRASLDSALLHFLEGWNLRHINKVVQFEEAASDGYSGVVADAEVAHGMRKGVRREAQEHYRRQHGRRFLQRVRKARSPVTSANAHCLPLER